MTETLKGFPQTDPSSRPFSFPSRMLFSVWRIPNTTLPVSTARLISLVTSISAIFFASLFFSKKPVLVFHQQFHCAGPDLYGLPGDDVFNYSLEQFLFALECGVKQVLDGFLK